MRNRCLMRVSGNNARLGAATISILLLWAITDASDVESQEGSYSIPSVSPSSVVIANGGNININFAIRPSDGVWDNYTVMTGTNIRIVCNNCSTDNFEITVNTEERSVNYTLNAETRYIIKWNNDRNLWDVFVSN